MPKVSVVIPAYNTLAYLPQSLASALEQTFTDFDVLIVDDGSADGVAAWAAQLSDPRVRLVTQANQGLPGARNTGVAGTEGEYIAFLDGDDLWRPDKLTKQVALLDKRPEVGLVHSSVRFIDARGDATSSPVAAHGDGDLYREFLTFNEFYMVRCGSTPLVRRACFDRVGVFDPSLKFAEDWEMWTRVAAHYHVAALSENLVSYRQHASNLTRNYAIMTPHFSKIIERAFSSAPGKYQHLKGRAYGRTHLSAAWRAFYAEDYAEASALRRQAFLQYPKLRLTKTGIRLSLGLARVRLPKRAERRA